MCKQKVTKIKLFIPAGAAAPTPPFGPILGQYGVNTVQFCKEFNETTEGLSLFFDDLILDNLGGFVLVVDIYINEDRSYKYFIKKPPVSFLLRLLGRVKIGAPQVTAGNITVRDLVYLAQFKFPKTPLLAACRILLGTARSIGVRVIK
jgi:large subunit ribosomal protein L11